MLIYAILLLVILIQSISATSTFTLSTSPVETAKDHYSTFSLSFSNADISLYPIDFEFKISSPASSYETKVPPHDFPYCLLSIDTGVGNTYPVSNEGPFSTDFASYDDQIGGTKYSLKLDEAPVGTTASSQLILLCHYETSFTVPIAIQVKDGNQSEVFQKVIFSIPKDAPNNALLTTAFGVSAIQTLQNEGNEFNLYLSNILPYYDRNLRSKLKFSIGSSVVIPSTGIAYAVDSTSSIISIGSETDPSPILTKFWFPDATLIDDGVNAIKIVISHDDLDTPLSFNVLFDNIPISTHPELITIQKLSPTIQLTNVLPFFPSDPFPATQIKYSWTIRTQSSTPATQTFTIVIPSQYRRSMFIDRCFLNDYPLVGADHSMQRNQYNVQLDVVNEFSFDCIINLGQSPWDLAYEYSDVKLISTIGSGLSTIIAAPPSPIAVGPVVQIPFVQLVGDNYPKLTLKPRDFTYLNSKPTWYGHLQMKGVRQIIPSIRFYFSESKNLDISNPSIFSFFGWSHSPESGNSFATTTALIEKSGSSIKIAFENPTGVNVVDLKGSFEVDCAIHSYPNNNNINADLIIDEPPSITLMESYYFNQKSQNTIDFPVAHLPKVTVDTTIGAVVSPFVDYEFPILFTIHKQAFHMPDQTTLSSLPTYSLWKLQPEVKMYVGAMITFAVKCTGCSFDKASCSIGTNSHWSCQSSPLAGNFDYFLVVFTLQDDMIIESDLQFSITPKISKNGRSDNFTLQIEKLDIQFESETTPVSQLSGNNGVIYFTNTILTGQTSIQFLLDSTPIDIKLLPDNGNEQQVPRPAIPLSPTVTLNAMFTPSPDGYDTQSIELCYYDNVAGVHRFIHLLTSATPNTMSPIAFNTDILSSVIKNAYLRLTYSHSSLSYPPTVVDTVYFDLIPACMKPDINNSGQYESKCTGDDVCIMATGLCQSLSPPSEPFSTKCPRCNSNNTDQCSEAQPYSNQYESCTCKNGWSGSTCNRSNLCAGDSSLCPVNNGYFQLIDPSTCGTACNCYGHWIHTNCQKCELTCSENGIARDDCDRCGCSEGYGGERCECQSAVGEVEFLGSNEIIKTTQGQLLTTNALFSFDNRHLSSQFTLPAGSTASDWKLFYMLKELFVSFENKLAPGGTFSMYVKPIGTGKAVFSFKMLYNCPKYNPTFPSLAVINTAFDQLTASLTTNPVIFKYFHYDSNTPWQITTTTRFHDAPSSLPSLQPRRQLFSSTTKVELSSPDMSSFTISIQSIMGDYQVHFAEGDLINVIVNDLPPWFNDESDHAISCKGAGLSPKTTVTRDSAGSPRYSFVLAVPTSKFISKVDCKIIIPRLSSFKPTLSRHLLPYYPHVNAQFVDNRFKNDPNYYSTSSDEISSPLPFVHQGVVCPPGKYGLTCEDNSADIPPATTPLQQLPPLSSTLPPTTANPTSICHVVMDVNGLYQRFNSSYTRMCSTPTSGTLTTTTLGINSFELPDAIKSYYIAQNPSLTTLTVCDCDCNGYWWDEPTTNDFKKCTRCIVPEGCPNMMTPNADCTACECSTPSCRKLSTYVFSTIYFNPKFLKIAINNLSDHTDSQVTGDLTFDELQAYLYHPSSSNKAKYRSIMSSFSKFLLNHYQTELEDNLYTSKLESITISPLIQGSFTTWKLTFEIINTAGSPMGQMSPLYGLSPFNKNISELFVQWCFDLTYQGLFGSTGLDSTSPLGLLLQSHVHVPMVSDSMKSAGTTVALFITDTVTTKCLTYQDHIKSTTDSKFIITPDILHTCPSPNQYIPVASNNGVMNQTMLTRYQQLNSMWSPCSGWDLSSTTSSLPKTTFYLNYESFLNDVDSLPQTTLSTREIFPQCFDFTGTNVGKLYSVNCQIPTDFTIYSTERDVLLNPTFFRSLLSSFNINDVPASNTKAIARLKKWKLTPFPKFPNFPQSTTVICPNEQPSSSTSPERCPFGKYGHDCQLDAVFDTQSLSASPTTLTIDGYSHIGWSYQGDDTQEITLLIKSSQKSKDGTGQYPFSQRLGTVPLSYLYSTPQIPTFIDSPLFKTIYDIIHAKDSGDLDGDYTDFNQVYNIDGSSAITIEGYLTRDATKIVTLNPSEQQGSFMSFNLPMICDQLDVTCFDTDRQYCYQGDGRCKCRGGYRADNIDAHEIEHPYQTGLNGGVIDGSKLHCVPICDNDGTWDNKTKKCNCKGDFGGEFCQERSTCDYSLCNSHGFIALTEQGECNTVTNTNDVQCKCKDGWKNTDINSPLNGNIDTLSSQCTFCPFYPYNLDYYSQTQLDEIQKWYSVPENEQYGKFVIDGMYTQTYTSSTTSSIDNSDPQKQQKQQKQRCYITGTDLDALKSQCPATQCPCKRGYGGEYCQLHIAYAKFPYKLVDGVAYNDDPMSQKIFNAKFIEEVSLSMLNYPSSQLFVDEHNKDELYVVIGFYSGLDFFQRNNELNQMVEETPSSFSVQKGLASLQSPPQQESSSFLFSLLTTTTTTTTPPGFFDPTLPPNLDSLYTQWGDLQQQFPTTPIKNQDSNNYLGEIGTPEPIQDPVCFEQNIIGCSNGEETKRMSSKALIIGLVVGLVCAALLLAILIGVLIYCKKNSCGLWKSQKEQERDEMSSFAFTQPSKKFNGSTNAPELTIGTTSMTPFAGGIELSSQPTSGTGISVQSVNNHTEVQDKTLPADVKAYKDTKGQIFYVNSTTMTTSWTHPNHSPNTETGGAAATGDDYGSGW